MTPVADKIHFKGLNGIRAFAALAVVLSHIGKELDTYGLPTIHDFAFAGYGVTVFFSLSGFLITYLLLAEKENFGKIDIKKFYTRRVFRIWPLYFLYLFVAILVTWLYEPQLLPGTIGWYFFLGANIPYIVTTALIPLVAHYWSLGVEEQFYLFWPVFIQNAKKALKAVSIFLVIWLILKGITGLIQWKTGNVVPYMIMQVTRFDCMALGALGAILFYQKNPLFLRICFSYPAQIIAWSVWVLIGFRYFHIASILDDEIVAALLVINIVNVSSNPRSIIKLDNKVFDFLGKISYGIYVIHPLVIFLLSKCIGQWVDYLPVEISQLIIFILVLLITIAIAYLSYDKFEKPFLVFKNRFSKIKSTA